MINSVFRHLPGLDQSSSQEPDSSELQTLKTELSNLQEDLSINVANGLLGFPALEYEYSAKSQQVDPVSEELHLDVSRYGRNFLEIICGANDFVD